MPDGAKYLTAPNAKERQTARDITRRQTAVALWRRSELCAVRHSALFGNFAPSGIWRRLAERYVYSGPRLTLNVNRPGKGLRAIHCMTRLRGLSTVAEATERST